MCFGVTSLFVNEWISVCRKEELSYHKYISERIVPKFGYVSLRIIILKEFRQTQQHYVICSDFTINR